MQERWHDFAEAQLKVMEERRILTIHALDEPIWNEPLRMEISQSKGATPNRYKPHVGAKQLAKAARIAERMDKGEGL